MLRQGLAVGLLGVWGGSAAGQSIDNLGTEFFMAFMPNYGGAWITQLHLSAPEPTTVRIEYPVNTPSFAQTVNLVPGDITIVNLPTTVPNWTDGVVRNNAVHAWSLTGDEFVCYQVNLREYTSDAAVALPVDTMGTEYIVTTHWDGFPEFVFFAAYDNTHVTVRPPGATAYNVTLHRGLGYMKQPGTDATGTIITADRPIGVVNGNVCVRYDGSQCDHLFEVAPPVQSWGMEIPVANIPETSLGVHYKIIASENATHVTLDGASCVTLNRGAFYYTPRIAGDHVFAADKPIFVTQFMANRGSSGGYPVGDPSLGNMIPAAQYQSSYTFSTVGGAQFLEHGLTIVAHNDDVGILTLDGVPVAAGDFTPIAGTELSVARLLLGEGVHNTWAPQGHGITVYGFNLYDSYLYPGGALFRFINPHGDPWPPDCACTEHEGPPPYFTCTATDDTPSEDLNGDGLLQTGEDLNGNGIIDRDTGIFFIQLTDDAVNLAVSTSFTPGDGQATYRVDLANPGQDGHGTVRVTDGAGNICETYVELVGNLAPTCSAGGAYAAECQGGVTTLTLDGLDSFDPDPQDQVSFAWSTNCPGGGFDDPEAPDPLLTTSTGGACNVACTVYLTVTDGRGGNAACQASVTVSDTQSPSLTASADDLTVECDGSGNAAQLQNWLATQGGAAAEDTCGAVTWSNSYTTLSDGCGATGATTVAFTANDGCGHTTGATATFSIVDNTPPTITTPASDLTVECDGTGNPAALTTWLDSHGGAVAADACSSVTWSHDFATLSDGCGATGATTVTFTATDACGYTATTSAAFTIIDNLPPQIVTAAGNLTVECDGAGNLSQLQAWLTGAGGAVATDNCGAVAWSNDFDTVVEDCGASGSATVTFTATDACGHTAATTATFTIADRIAPALVSPPANLTVECDGTGNSAQLNAWLGDHGGATVNEACSAVAWSHDFTGLSDECAATGAATVTFTATDACGLATSAPASFTIADTLPPTLTCPDDVTLGWGAPDHPLVLEWLNGATAHDACDPDVTVVNNAPPEGFPFESSTLVTWTATDACGHAGQCSATITITAAGRVDAAQKGSLLIYPKVEVRWNAAGQLIQDTFVALTNDGPSGVIVQTFLVQGDPPLAANPPERAHLGYNRIGSQIGLTANEPCYWAVSSGMPKGLAPFRVLDPTTNPLQPGRPATDGTNDRVMRGFVVAWVVNAEGDEVHWNHLKGDALIVNYAKSAAWEYGAYAFMAHADQEGQALGTPGELYLDGTEYDFCADLLLLDFFAVGADALNGVTRTVQVDTDLTLLPLRIDLRQDTDGWATTKANFDIWNSNEVKFSGTHRCITLWDQQLLRLYDGPNHFLRTNLQTNKGYARIDGLASEVCNTYDAQGQPLMVSEPAALLGVTLKILTFSGGNQVEAAGTTLTGAGLQVGVIRYDPLAPPPELTSPADEAQGNEDAAPLNLTQVDPVRQTHRTP